MKTGNKGKEIMKKKGRKKNKEDKIKRKKK